MKGRNKSVGALLESDSLVQNLLNIWGIFEDITLFVCYFFVHLPGTGRVELVGACISNIHKPFAKEQIGH